MLIIEIFLPNSIEFIYIQFHAGIKEWLINSKEGFHFYRFPAIYHLNLLLKIANSLEKRKEYIGHIEHIS